MDCKQGYDPTSHDKAVSKQQLVEEGVMLHEMNVATAPQPTFDLFTIYNLNAQPA